MVSVAASAKQTSVFSDIPLELTQLRNNYGISFVAAPQDASRQPISTEQAVSAAFQGYIKPRDVSAMFGYITINSYGNAVFVPPTTEAGKEYNGVVKNYPVWLVSEADVKIYSHGPKALPPYKGSMYTFVDATNGQRFFTVTVSDKQ